MKKLILTAGAYIAICVPLSAGNDACSGDVSFQDAVSYNLQITYVDSDFIKKESHLAEFNAAFTRKGDAVDACVKYSDLVFDQYQKLPNDKQIDFKISTKLMNNYHSQLVKNDILSVTHPITIAQNGKVTGEPIKPVDKNDTTLDYRAIMLLPWVRDVYCADFSAGVFSPLVIRPVKAMAALKVGESMPIESQNIGGIRGCFSATYKCEEQNAEVYRFSVNGKVSSCNGVACELVDGGEIIDLTEEDGTVVGSVLVDIKRGVVIDGKLIVNLKAKGQTTRTTKHNAVGHRYPLEIEQEFYIGRSAKR